jgi:hypothetical protein
MRRSEGEERKGGHLWGRHVGLLGIVALAMSTAACNAPIPDVQVTPNYAGIVQRNLGTSETVAILEMTDGTTQTIDMKAQRSVYGLPSVAVGWMLLLSTVPGSLGAATLPPCHPETDCWYMTSGGKDALGGYVLTDRGFRLKKSAGFKTWVTSGTYPSNGSFGVDRNGELISYG